MKPETESVRSAPAPEKMEWQAPELIKLDTDLTDVANSTGVPNDSGIEGSVS